MIGKILLYLLNKWQNRESEKTLGAPRSPQWSKVRDAHLKQFPTCAICGGKDSLNVHHIQPFHLHPELELDPNNLITLCECVGKEHHLIFGHLGSYQSFNKDILTDSQIWNDKIKNRP